MRAIANYLFILAFGFGVYALLGRGVMPLLIDTRLSEFGVDVVMLRTVRLWRIPYEEIVSAEHTEKRVALFKGGKAGIALMNRTGDRVLLVRRDKRPILLTPAQPDGFVTEVARRIRTRVGP